MTQDIKTSERRHTLARLVGMGGLLAGAAGLSLFGGRIGAAESADNDLMPLQGRRELVRNNHLPNVRLVNQHRETMYFYDDLVKDKTVVINFFYSLCSEICPLSTSNLVEAERDLKRLGHHDVSFVGISLAPEFDTAEVLQAYSEQHGAGPGWNFVTGQREDIEHLRRSLGVYDADPELDKNPTRHTGLAVIGNEPAGRWRATPALAKPVRIRQAIERVLLPASAWPDGRSVVDEVPYDDDMALGEAVDPEMITQLQQLVSQR
jgi:protein SCO1